MTLRGRGLAIALGVLGLVVGVVVGRRGALPAGALPAGVLPAGVPSDGTPPNGTPPDGRPTLRTRELKLTHPGSPATIVLGMSQEESPAMWLGKGPRGGSAQLGLHGNGFPFALVSDARIQTFGLLRVDGPNASPILVYRKDDDVKMVFGLSMTEAGRPPFLVRYTAAGKENVIGCYDDCAR